MVPSTKRTLNWVPYLLLWMQPLFMAITSLYVGSFLWVSAVPLTLLLIVLLFVRNRVVSIILGYIEYLTMAFGFGLLLAASAGRTNKFYGIPGNWMWIGFGWFLLGIFNCVLIFSPQGSRRNPVHEILPPPAPILPFIQQPMTYSTQPTYAMHAPHFVSSFGGSFVNNQPPPAYSQAYAYEHSPQFVSEKK